MASGWAYFRKHWIKPEVYPLIGSMAAALGVCGAAMINKARDPAVGWNKSKRKSDLLLDDVEEVVPMWSSAKHNSTRIFGTSKDIMESKSQFTTLPDPVTVKIGNAEEETEEEEHAPVPEEQPAASGEQPVSFEEQTAAPEEQKPTTESQPPEIAAAHPVTSPDGVIDEEPEIIKAAIDAAIQADASEQTASSVTEQVPPAPAVQPNAAES